MKRLVILGGGESGVGTTTAAGVAISGVSGVASTTFLGDEQVVIPITQAITGVAGTGNIGEELVTGEGSVVETGEVGTGSVNSVTLSGGATVTPGHEETSVSATGAVTSLIVWGEVDDSQTPNYQSVTDSQTVDWQEVA